MINRSDFGGGNESNRYCKHCTLSNGVLKPLHEVRESMIAYYMKAKKWERTQATQFVDEKMAGQPAWK